MPREAHLACTKEQVVDKWALETERGINLRGVEGWWIEGWRVEGWDVRDEFFLPELREGFAWLDRAVDRIVRPAALA